MSLGQRLKEIRKDRGLNQTEFATTLKSTRSAYSKYEVDDVVPSDVFIELLCSKYDVNELWLRYGKGEKYKTLTDEERLMKFVADLIKDDRKEVQETAMLLPTLNNDQLELMYNLALQLQQTKKDDTP